jgi:hypothetical protein
LEKEIVIIVRVELHSALTGKVTEIARMMIHNIGGTKNSGDYGVHTFRGRGKDALDTAQENRTTTRRGIVLRHQRLTEHVWFLVAKALKAVAYDDYQHSRYVGFRKEHSGSESDGALPNKEPGQD